MRRLAYFTVVIVVLLMTACGDDGIDAGGDCAEGVVETDSGLRYEDLECRDGDTAGRGDVVIVNYAVSLEGEDEPFASGPLPPFEVGTGGVVQGFDEGVIGMREGGKRRLIVPPELGYGAQGRPPDIPPDTNLIFEVELLEIQES